MVLVRCHLNPVQILRNDAAPKKRRPADGEGKKIPPFDLEKCRDKYDFRYPCCLCADGGGREAYVEAAVYPWWNKTTKNTYWTARCASDKCGYQGQCCSCSRRSHTNHHLVKIDMYSRRAPLAAFQYPRRGMNLLLQYYSFIDG
jgi:hypothetical protein